MPGFSAISRKPGVTGGCDLRQLGSCQLGQLFLACQKAGLRLLKGLNLRIQLADSQLKRLGQPLDGVGCVTGWNRRCRIGRFGQIGGSLAWCNRNGAGQSTDCGCAVE